MATGWTWPLVISVLRLVFISALTVINWAALYRVVSTKKYKAGQRQERLLVTTIIVVSLVYLSVVWSPFTFTALKHDISDIYQTQEDFGVEIKSPDSLPRLQKLSNDIDVNKIKQKKEDKFTVEYIDLLPSLDVLPDPLDIQEEISVEYLDVTSDDDDDLDTADSAVDTDNDYNEEFTVEYIDIRTGKPVKKNSLLRVARAAPEKPEAAWTLLFHSQPKDPLASTRNIPLHSIKELPPPPVKTSKETTDTMYWNSDIQDLVTSSCAYSLAFTAVIRLVIMRRFVLCTEGGWVLGMWSGLAVGIPGAITLLVRTIGKTTTHFAPHQPEYTAAGYFLYNIICDVHISEEYVVSVFLEWAALFTLLLMVLAVIFALGVRANKDDEDSYGPLHDDGNGRNSNVEAWARDVVLIVGTLWSWPIKPLLVLILYSLYGSHWTNLVCWIAHVVVAIPVVFIPLAVFLSRSHSDKPSPNIYIIDEDHNLSENQTEEKKIKEENVKNHFNDMDKVQNNNDFHSQQHIKDGATASEHQSKEKGRSQARENLKFYLGKDIFKYGFKSASKKEEEDRRIILANEWGETSISEA